MLIGIEEMILFLYIKFITGRQFWCFSIVFDYAGI